MSQNRRQFIATCAAATVAPALPAVAATSPQLEAWPSEIVELNRIATAIIQYYQNANLADQWRSEGEDEMAEYFKTKADIEAARLRRMKPVHGLSKEALRNHFYHNQTTPLPHYAPPFLR